MNSGALIPTFVYSFQVPPSLIRQFFSSYFFIIYTVVAPQSFHSTIVISILHGKFLKLFSLFFLIIFVQFLHWPVTIFLNFNLPNIIHVHCIMLYVHVCMWLYVCFYKLFSNTQINAKHMAQIVSNLFRRKQVCYNIFSILPNIFNICTSNFCQTFLLLFSAVPNQSTIGFWRRNFAKSKFLSYILYTREMFKSADSTFQPSKYSFCRRFL